MTQREFFKKVPMPIDDPDDLERIDRQIRINELKAQAEQLAGGAISAGESDLCPPDLAEAFWRHVVDFETAEKSTHFANLVQRGVPLPPPVELADDRLHAVLHEVIHALADMNVYLCSTDHLSGRELYHVLWTDVLREETPQSLPSGTNCHIDLVGSGSAEDIRNWLRYYADDESRADWKESFPDDELPPRQKPPYDRDRHLPQARD